jgi:hypothetical protein
MPVLTWWSLRLQAKLAVDVLTIEGAEPQANTGAKLNFYRNREVNLGSQIRIPF